MASTARLIAGLFRRDVRILLLGDPSLAWLGTIARFFRTPVAVVVHGLDITYPPAWYQAYLRMCFWNRFDAYICISTHVASLVAGHGTPSNRIHLIHPGVEVDASIPEAPVAGGVNLLLLGRLVRRKGALWFVTNVLPYLTRQLADLKLHIVGDGPDRDAIERAVVRLGLQENVRILGMVNEDQKLQCMKQAHALVLPNLPFEDDPEGFGLVALEGAAAAKYVFASDLDGLRDAVRDPHTGKLLPPADADAWIQILARECSDVQRLIGLGARAREAIGDATWAGMGKRYRQVLSALA
jgi:phosphatidylinositol alpha-1,6-mannosyltransferase